MALVDFLDGIVGMRKGLVLAFFVSLIASVAVLPLTIVKLRGAGIVGRDIHKPDRPEIPEMGGIAVYMAFNVGVFLVLALGDLNRPQESLILVGLIVVAGAAITGVIDDLIILRQQFKAFIPVAFSIPLVLYVDDFSIAFPWAGTVEIGSLYALVLIPLGIAAASNGLNMLEGFNGLGTGLALITMAALTIMTVAAGNLLGLALLLPLAGASLGFLYYNAYPAKIFPGDTFTLTAGAAIATAAILSKIEFWAALLFVPHVIEFFLKARGRFSVQCFATSLDQGSMIYEGPTRSLTHVFMKSGRWSEPQLVFLMWGGHAAWAAIVVSGFIGST